MDVRAHLWTSTHLHGHPPVIHDLIKTPEVRVQQILVEFHHFFPNISFKETQAAIDGLIGNGYKVFDISKRGYEFGFIRL